MYARIVNGEIDRLVDELPKSVTLGEVTLEIEGETIDLTGATVGDFDRLSAEERLQRGEDWRPVVDDEPDFDPDTEELGDVSYTVEPTQVIRTFAVVAKPPAPPAPPTPDPVPSPQERIAWLEAQVAKLSEATDTPLDPPPG